MARSTIESTITISDEFTPDERAWIEHRAVRDVHWRAILIVLASPELGRDGRVWRHVDLAGGTVDFRRMLRSCRSMSSGEYALVRIAASLWNSDHEVSLHRAFYSLSGSWAERALRAIAAFARG